jgi:hypothetical protein
MNNPMTAEKMLDVIKRRIDKATEEEGWQGE